ncbi:hypothetical protein KA012_03810 [Candidatus Woesebacteria bacterium]|nr:hypothetical protein [Candidatus Woesebacteria bacterium]
MIVIDQAPKQATDNQGLPQVDVSPRAGTPAHLDTSVQFPDGAAGISFRRKAEAAEPPSADVLRELRSLLGLLKDLKPDYDTANKATMAALDALNNHLRNPIERRTADQLTIIELAEQQEALDNYPKQTARLQTTVDDMRTASGLLGQRRNQLIADVVTKFTESSGSEEWKTLAQKTRTEIEDMYGENTAWDLSRYS